MEISGSTATPQNRFARHKRLTLFIILIVGAIAFDFLMGTIFLVKSKEQPERLANAYYNHDIMPNFAGTNPSWGTKDVKPYKIYTNSLGFKDRAVRDIPLTTSKKRVLFIGDSFTEGIGVEYDQTFVGHIAKELEPRGYDIQNAGVSSYSPIIYYLKTKYLLEHGFRFDELVVFMDISDAQDEVDYQSWTPTTPDAWGFRWNNFSLWLDRYLGGHSVTYLHVIRTVVHGRTERRLRALFFGDPIDDPKEAKYSLERGRWTFDDEVYDDWGAKGVALEIKHMDKLAALSREYGFKLSIAVYPWPAQIEHRDINSRQVAIWRAFSRENGLNFYNLFPPFMATTTDPATVLRVYFFDGDVHWNETGHALIAKNWLAQYLETTK